MNHHLKCPDCGRSGNIELAPTLQDIQLAACTACNYRIAVHDGVPDFAEHVQLADPKLGIAQRLMNSRYFPLVYESPIWRPLHTYIGSGLTMSQEVQAVLEMAKTDNAHLIVDLACGTGHYARAFADVIPGAVVFGVDISLSMLTHARRLARQKALKQIVFLRGDIYQLPFDDQSVDWVHCGGALHLFADLSPIWTEIARVIKPGGVFTVMTVALAGGLIGKLQQRIMRQGRATFFRPGLLAADLNNVNLSSFQYRQNRVTLLFSAIKKLI